MPRTLIALLFAVPLSAGCGSRPVPGHRAGGSTSEKAEYARKLADALAAESARQSAAAVAKAVPSLAKGKAASSVVVVVSKPELPLPGPKPLSSPLVKAPPRVTSPVLISDKVSSAVAYTDPAEAEEDALTQAAERIEQRLRELGVSFRPSSAVVRSEYVRRDTRTTREPNDVEKKALVDNGYSAERKYVEFEIQLTADQIRELRTQGRVGDAMRATGVLAAVALAAFLFLRLDEWTKGYLTSWLAVGAVLLGGAVAAVAVFI